MRLCPICESAGNAEFFAKDDRWLLIAAIAGMSGGGICPRKWNSRPTIARTTPEPIPRRRSSRKIGSTTAAIWGELLAVLGRGPRETVLLDYGCSIPVLAHEAVKLSFRKALGVDWADEVKQCGGKWGVEILTPPELASIPDRSLDIARFSHTIEHSIDPLATLRTVLPKMRTGGLIYIHPPQFPRAVRAAVGPGPGRYRLPGAPAFLFRALPRRDGLPAQSPDHPFLFPSKRRPGRLPISAGLGSGLRAQSG